MPPPTPEQTMQWLQRGGSIEDIFGVPGGQQTMPFMDEDQRDYINDRGITMARGNDLYADPMTRIMLGAAPGGYGPESFNPTYTYEDVKAPAYTRLMQMQGANDAVSRIIAEVMLNKGTAFEAENAVLDSMMNEKDADGNVNPDYQELQNMQALWEGRGVNRSPNTSRIQKITDNIEKMALDDPVFNAINPATGRPANVVDEDGNPIIEQEDGSWAREIETQGIGAQEYERLGFASPYETYNRDDFAQPGVLAEEERTRQRLDDAMNKYMLSQEEYDSPETSKAIDLEAEDNANRLRAIDAFERRAAAEQAAQPSAPVDPMLGENLAADASTMGLNGMDLLTQIGEGQASSPTAPSQAQPRPQTGGAFADPMVPETTSDQWIGNKRFEVRHDAPQSRYMQQGRQEARSDARRQSLLDKADMYRASGSAKADMYSQEKRDAYVRFLAKQGFNPYGDQMRGLQQQVYGQ